MGNLFELKINILKKEAGENKDTIMAQIGLGADYIGPSVYWACEAGMTAEHREVFRNN